MLDSPLLLRPKIMKYINIYLYLIRRMIFSIGILDQLVIVFHFMKTNKFLLINLFYYTYVVYIFRKI